MMGRPVIAAKSLEEALLAVKNRTAPRRARNEFERIAGARRRGRHAKPSSPTRIAAELAHYLMCAENLPQHRAIRQAIDLMPAPIDTSNVRRYLKRFAAPTISCAYSGTDTFLRALPPRKLPLIASVEDVT